MPSLTMIRRKRLYARSASPRSTMTVIVRDAFGVADALAPNAANGEVNADDMDVVASIVDRAAPLTQDVDARMHALALASARAAVCPRRSNAMMRVRACVRAGCALDASRSEALMTARSGVRVVLKGPGGTRRNKTAPQSNEQKTKTKQKQRIFLLTIDARLARSLINLDPRVAVGKRNALRPVVVYVQPQEVLWSTFRGEIDKDRPIIDVNRT